jgi:hypothetical protein
MTRSNHTEIAEAKAARNAALKEASARGEAEAAAVIHAGGTVMEAQQAMVLMIRNEMRRYDEAHDGFLNHMKAWRRSLGDHVATPDEILAEVDRYEANRR